MAVYGYHRTSTTEQHLDRGITQITDYCKANHLDLVKIYTDQKTGKNFDRPRYTVLKEDVLRDSDWLIITEIDRLGRDKKQTLQELRDLNAMGVRVLILEIPTTLMDLDGMENQLAQMMLQTISDLMVEIYAAMSEAEIKKKELRQRQGIEEKRRRGEWDDYGRPATKKPKDWNLVIAEWKAGRMTARQAWERLGVKKTTFYKLVKEK